MKKIILIVVSLTLLAFGTATHAADIIYTGPGPDGAPGYIFDSTYWMAAEFTLPTAYEITDVEGWMYVVSGSHMANISIYNDGGDLPGNPTPFSQSFNVINLPPADWVGLTGLSWSLPAGTYWAVFGGSGTLQVGMPFPSANPLPYIGYTRNSGTSWEIQDLKIGVWIQGTPAAVPVPPSLFLLGSGLAGLGIFRRKNKKT